MENEKSIFLVTCIGYSKLNPYIKDGYYCRTWGWYSTLQQAQKSILGNIGDMFEEGYYKHAVIEEMPEGIMPIPIEHDWYEASYAADLDATRIRTPNVITIQRPDKFEGMIGFSLG